jgi:hypothetical protein
MLEWELRPSLTYRRETERGVKGLVEAYDPCERVEDAPPVERASQQGDWGKGNETTIRWLG